MTIPITTPQIQPQLAPPQPTAIQIITQALQRRQELQLAQQELAQRREQFELHKKLAGSELEGMKLQQEKQKREFQQQEDDLVARLEANQHYIASLPELDNTQGLAQVVGRIKDPAVRAHFLDFFMQGLKAK